LHDDKWTKARRTLYQYPRSEIETEPAKAPATGQPMHGLLAVLLPMDYSMGEGGGGEGEGGGVFCCY